MRVFRGPASVVFAVLILALFLSCSEDSPTGAGLEPPDYDITSTWAFTEVADETDCDEGTNTYNYDVTIVQDGNQITVTMEGEEFSGTISASTVKWSGSFPEDGGTTTIHSVSLSVTNDGQSLDGNMSWSWSDGTDSCSGTSELTADKIG